MISRSPNGAAPRSGRQHRWAVTGTAVLTALSAALVAAPAGAAGTPPQITVVVSHAGPATVTLGHPKPVATADISAGDLAYDPTNGDEAVSVVTGAGQAHVYLIAGATEPNEYHIETTATGPTYGALVKGDVYLVAGSGPLSMISDPGASTALTGGSTSPVATANPIAPRSVTFDHSGNLLIAESDSTTVQIASGIQIVAKTACSVSCPYGYSTLAAGDLYTIVALGGWRGSTRTPALVLGFQVNGWGVAVDSSGNIVDSANGAVLFINEQSSSVSRYGKTLASKQATVIAGTATGTGAGTCGDGNKNVPATGGTSANLQFPHPIVDASGNVYVNDNRGAADTGCTWVLPAATGTLDGQTMTAGDLYSLTGAATTTAATNGAVANTAGLPNPSGVALDPAGNLVVSLAGGTPALAVIAESTDTYYDQSMTKGHVYLISGGASATRTTTPGNATGFKFSGTAAVATEATPPFGITSLVTGAPGDLLLADGTSATTGTLYLVTGGPTGAPVPTPTITSIEPTTGPLAGGTVVTIDGTNLTDASVEFGTVGASTVVVKDPTTLTAKVPRGSEEGKISVSVTTLGGTAIDPTGFTYTLTAPTIVSITPHTGSVLGGTMVTISGTNLTGATVDFASTSATTVVVRGPTSVTVHDPPHSAGTVAVSVTTGGGTATLTTAFTYIEATPPDAPTGVTATRAGSGKVQVDWKAPATDGGSPITGYTVTSTPTGKSCATTGALTCTVDGLTNGTTYGFTVRATNAAGTSIPSVPSHLVPATIPGSPGTPTAVPGDESAVIRWTAPTPTISGSPITQYTVTSAPTARTCTAPAMTTHLCTMTTLKNGTTYTFTVQATNAVGTGPTSTPSNAAIPEPSLPGAPTDVAAEAGDGDALVSWAAPASDGGSPITGYTATSTPSGKTCTTTGALSCIVSGLTNGDTYTFAVSATNAEGTGATSTPSLPVTPTSSAPVTPTGPPTQGYWEVASDGGIFAFGTAQYYGSMGGKPLAAPVVGLVATNDDGGYWEVAGDGGIFAFGDAQFYGSMGGQPLDAPVVGLVAASGVTAATGRWPAMAGSSPSATPSSTARWVASRWTPRWSAWWRPRAAAATGRWPAMAGSSPSATPSSTARWVASRWTPRSSAWWPPTAGRLPGGGQRRRDLRLRRRPVLRLDGRQAPRRPDGRHGGHQRRWRLLGGGPRRRDLRFRRRPVLRLDGWPAAGRRGSWHRSRRGRR